MGFEREEIMMVLKEFGPTGEESLFIIMIVWSHISGTVVLYMRFDLRIALPCTIFG